MRGLLCKHHKMTKTNQNHKTENPNGPTPPFFSSDIGGRGWRTKKTLAVSQLYTSKVCIIVGVLIEWFSDKLARDLYIVESPFFSC